MNCRICNRSSDRLWSEVVLRKYQVEYYKCSNCGFIQTEDPYWLDEAYASAITSIDIGLMYRNLINVPITSAIINKFANPEGKFIDYGGGYGMFTRLMRDKGFEYFRQDAYCENLFAKHFDITDLSVDEKFEMLTAFEVFEHLSNPKQELEKMLEYSNNIFFSTELVPHGLNDKKWWYLMPETGQHISLYSQKSLIYLAKENKLNFYSNGTNLHLLTKGNIYPYYFKLLTRYKVSKLYCYLKGKRTSLLMKDYQYVKQLNSGRSNEDLI